MDKFGVITEAVASEFKMRANSIPHADVRTKLNYLISEATVTLFENKGLLDKSKEFMKKHWKKVLGAAALAGAAGTAYAYRDELKAAGKRLKEGAEKAGQAFQNVYQVNKAEEDAKKNLCDSIKDEKQRAECLEKIEKEYDKYRSMVS